MSAFEPGVAGCLPPLLRGAGFDRVLVDIGLGGILGGVGLCQKLNSLAALNTIATVLGKVALLGPQRDLGARGPPLIFEIRDSRILALS